jgi:hypothetical protein
VIHQRSAQFAAKLSFVDADGRPVSRELEGNGCEDVVSALALITALAIDPLLSEAKPADESVTPLPPEDGGRTQPVTPPRAETTPKAVTGATLDGFAETHTFAPETSEGELPREVRGELGARGPLRAESGHSSDAGSGATNPELVPPQQGASQPQSRTSSPVPPLDATSRQGRQDAAANLGIPSLGAALGIASDVAPEWAPTVSLLAELSSRRRNAAVRLELSYAWSSSTPTEGTRSEFGLIAGAIEGCPVALSLRQGLRLWPCAALEAGLFHAEGQRSAQLPLPDDVSALWLATNVGLRAQIDLNRVFALEFGSKLRVPLLRHRYVFEQPFVDVHETPPVGALVFVGFSGSWFDGTAPQTTASGSPAK